jgi:hypothetical protein
LSSWYASSFRVSWRWMEQACPRHCPHLSHGVISQETVTLGTAVGTSNLTSVLQLLPDQSLCKCLHLSNWSSPTIFGLRFVFSYNRCLLTYLQVIHHSRMMAAEVAYMLTIFKRVEVGSTKDACSSKANMLLQLHPKWTRPYVYTRRTSRLLPFSLPGGFKEEAEQSKFAFSTKTFIAKLY